MYWQARLVQENPDQKIIQEMHKIRKEHKDFGCLRMTHEVREAGYLVNKKNLIHRRFYTSVVHQKITTDTTELNYYERDSTGELRQKKLYLDPFTALFNSDILSFRISNHPNTKAVMDALEEAIQVTADCLHRRTFHSDCGWVYQSKLKTHAIFQSFSRKGNCLDNSPMENFFSIL